MQTYNTEAHLFSITFINSFLLVLFMKKRSGKKRFIIGILFISLFVIFFNSSLVYAENLNLKITGIINNINSNIYLKTNPNAVNGIDSYDMPANDLPSGDYSQFYSSVSGNKLAIDSWNASSNPRTLDIVYKISNAQTGTLDFSWPALAGSYNATFMYYGDDSSYSNLIESTNMRTSSFYAATLTGYSNVYVRVNVSNITQPSFFCGDASCNNGETCTSCPGDCGVCPAPDSGGNGGGGGGGGGGSTINAVSSGNFNIDQDLIQVSLKKGESSRQSVTIKNTGTKTMSFNIIVSDSIKNLLFLSDDKISLAPNEKKIIYLTFASPEGIDPGIYSGNLNIKSDSGEKKVLISSSISEKTALFDISVKIPENYKKLYTGDSLFFEISLLNMGQVGRVDASIKYKLQDFDGNVLEEKDEMVAVETQASFSRTIILPDNIKPGKYLMTVDVKYGNKSEGSSSDVFNVAEKNSGRGYLLIEIISFIVLIIFIVAIIFYFKSKRLSKLKQ